MLSRVWRLPIRRKLVLVEALMRTLAAWIMIRLTPYAAWRSKLGRPLPLTSIQVTGVPAHRSGNALLEEVAWAHGWLGRLFPTHFTCLMLAFSARGMLRQRRVSTVLVLGAKRGQGASIEKLVAHAWVLSQGFEIVGGETREGHIPVAAYCDSDQGIPL
jgi:hypothetical protein